ncbi:MAG TPA: Uma2 family endonuclease [Isosphaeraceae bacterium]|jgi:Uma2 family endonuclease|nr:Uma2 family endonuclease [Isosphaeraceae bacterium]
MPVETETATAANGPALDAIAPERLYRFRVEQYDAMAEHGILTPEDRVELLEGWVVRKMGKNPPHMVVNGLVQDALTRLLPPGWFVSIQDPVTAGTSEPEPDVKVVRGDRRDYLRRRVGPADVGLVVEVSDSSLKEDQTFKKQIYARAGIPFYWIINIPDTKLLVHGDPTGPAATPDYRRVVELGPADEVPLVLDGREVGRIAVRDLLP